MKKFRTYISTFALLVLLAIMAPVAHAIGAAPLRANLQAAPGETVEGYIVVQNTSGTSQEAVLTKGDFRVREDESMQFLMEVSEENEWSMQDWIEIQDNNILLEAGERVELKYTVTVPENAKSQSYYGVIFVGGKTPADNGQEGGIGISTNIAHLILLEVTGDLHADIELQSFEMMKNGAVEDGVKEIRFETRLFNKGNTHTAPEGRMLITNAAREIIDEFPLNKDLFNDLPNRQKTLVNRWDYSTQNTGRYYAYIDGNTKENQTFSAEMAFEITGDGQPVMLETQLHKSYKEAIGQKERDLVLPLAVLAVILAAAIVALSVSKRHGKKRGKKRFLGLFTIMLLCGMTFIPSVLAQGSDDLTINMTVDEATVASLDLNGCWNDTGGDTWEFDVTDTTANLNQPGDRENGAGGDQYDFYDIAGGSGNGILFLYDTHSFGYDDCQLQVTARNWSSWDITLYGDDLDDAFTNEIPDMALYNNNNFDFNIENEDPNTGSGTQYPITDAEHGFFIVNSSGMPAAEIDDGTVGGADYSLGGTGDKAYDATSCGDGSVRPCYHFVPDMGNPHTLYNSSSNVTDSTFVLRFGAGIDETTEPTTFDMTVTVTLNTTP